MMGMLKAIGMIVVLILLSEGFFVLRSALEGRDASGVRPTAAKVEMVAGGILCSSALMLLYSLGTRDEK